MLADDLAKVLTSALAFIAHCSDNQRDIPRLMRLDNGEEFLKTVTVMRIVDKEEWKHYKIL